MKFCEHCGAVNLQLKYNCWACEMPLPAPGGLPLLEQYSLFDDLEFVPSGTYRTRVPDENF